MSIVERYTEILASRAYHRVAFRNIRGIVTEDQVVFLDPDGEMIGIIDPSFDNLFMVADDRFFDTICAAVNELACDPDEFFS